MRLLPSYKCGMLPRFHTVMLTCLPTTQGLTPASPRPQQPPHHSPATCLPPGQPGVPRPTPASKLQVGASATCHLCCYIFPCVCYTSPVLSAAQILIEALYSCSLHYLSFWLGRRRHPPLLRLQRPTALRPCRRRRLQAPPGSGVRLPEQRLGQHRRLGRQGGQCGRGQRHGRLVRCRRPPSHGGWALPRARVPSGEAS